MALRQLLNRSCNSPDMVFRTIRDFLAAANGIDDFSPGGATPGPGYEIVDASYASGDPTNTTANDWCVLRSRGEAESYPTYVRLNFGASQHGINIGLHWDADAHSGFGFTNRATNIYHNGAGEVLLYIYADLDEIHIVMRPRAVTTWYWHPCCRLKPDATFYDGAAVQVAGAIEAGDNVEIVLPSWPGWAANGRRIYSWDGSGLGEVEIVASDAASLKIVAASAAARAAGSWLAEDITLLTNSSHNSKADGSDAKWLVPSRSPVAVNPVACTASMLAVPGVDAKYNTRYGCDIWMQRAGEIRGRLSNARASRAAASAQGEAWTDDEGVPWRLHTVYDGVVMAFREAA